MKKRRNPNPASKAGARCLTNSLVNMCIAEDKTDCTGIVASAGPAEKPGWQRPDIQGKISGNGQRTRCCQSPRIGARRVETGASLQGHLHGPQEEAERTCRYYRVLHGLCGIARLRGVLPG